MTKIVSTVSSYGSWTIQFIQGEDIFKLCRIWFGADGSYYVTAPYHTTRQAAVFIASVFYDRPTQRVIWKESVTRCALFDDDKRRLKLAHHPDGFLQFSGYGVTSGKDMEGKPKGLGIQSFDLRRPHGHFQSRGGIPSKSRVMSG